MATINLGSIKFNWKGAYAGGTAYVVDDVVSYNGSSYVCILASTGNLPTDATYFEQMSSAGTNGTDGTDLGTTLTTQGDIVYRDGSGLARLGAGTSGQVLQTNGTGANPSWGTVSSDWVKLAETNVTTAVNVVQFQNIFTSDYDTYKIFASGLSGDSALRQKVRFMSGSTPFTGGDYYYVIEGAYGENAGSSTFLTRARGDNYYQMYNWDIASSNVDVSSWEMTVFDPVSTGHYTNASTQFSAIEGGFTYQITGTSFGAVTQTTSYDGIEISTSVNNFDKGKFQVYGIK